MADWKERISADQMPEVYRKFSDVIGIDATLKLCENFGGEQTYIPTISAAYNVFRNAEIIRRYKQGERVTDIAQRYGMTRVNIYNIVNDDGTNGNAK